MVDMPVSQYTQNLAPAPPGAGQVPQGGPAQERVLAEMIKALYGQHMPVRSWTQGLNNMAADMQQALMFNRLANIERGAIGKGVGGMLPTMAGGGPMGTLAPVPQPGDTSLIPRKPVATVPYNSGGAQENPKMGDAPAASPETSKVASLEPPLSYAPATTTPPMGGGAQAYLSGGTAGPSIGGTGSALTDSTGIAEISAALRGGAPGMGGPIDRSNFAEEVQNPNIVRRLAEMVKGEVGLGRDPEKEQIQLESVFNRSDVRDHPLSQGLLSVREAGNRGYYASDTYSNHRPVSPDELNYFQTQLLPKVMGGSDLAGDKLGFPVTGNASGNFAQNRAASGKYYADAAWYSGKPKQGEMFVLEKSDAPRINKLYGGQQSTLAGKSTDAVGTAAFTPQQIAPDKPLSADLNSPDTSAPIKTSDLPAFPQDIPVTENWSPTGFAKGGIVTEPTLAVIGEAGPEAVVPLTGDTAMNGADQTNGTQPPNPWLLASLRGDVPTDTPPAAPEAAGGTADGIKATLDALRASKAPAEPAKGDGDQMATALNSGKPIQLAAARGGGGTGGTAGNPGAVRVAAPPGGWDKDPTVPPGSIPLRPTYSPQQFQQVMMNAWALPPQAVQGFLQAYFAQFQPLEVKVTGGTVRINPNDYSQQKYIPDLLKSESQMGDMKQPKYQTVGPGGTTIQNLTPTGNATATPAPTPAPIAPRSVAPPSPTAPIVPSKVRTIPVQPSTGMPADKNVISPPGSMLAPPGPQGALTPPPEPVAPTGQPAQGGKAFTENSPPIQVASGSDFIPSTEPPRPDAGTAPPTQLAQNTFNFQPPPPPGLATDRFTGGDAGAAPGMLGTQPPTAPPQPNAVNDAQDQAIVGAGFSPQDIAAYRAKKQIDTNAEYTRQNTLEMGKAGVKRYNDLTDLATGAAKQLTLLNIGKKVIEDDRNYQGPGANAVLLGKQILAQLPGGDAKGAAPGEMFKKIIAGSVLENSRLTLQGAGQWRVMEIKLNQDALASPMNTRAANMALMDISVKQHQQTIDVHNMATDYVNGEAVHDPNNYNNIIAPANTDSQGNVIPRNTLDAKWNHLVNGYYEKNPIYSKQQIEDYTRTFDIDRATSKYSKLSNDPNGGLYGSNDGKNWTFIAPAKSGERPQAPPPASAGVEPAGRAPIAAPPAAASAPMPPLDIPPP